MEFKIKETYKNSKIIKAILKVENIIELRDLFTSVKVAIIYHEKEGNNDIQEFFEEQKKAIIHKMEVLKNEKN